MVLALVVRCRIASVFTRLRNTTSSNSLNWTLAGHLAEPELDCDALEAVQNPAATYAKVLFEKKRKVGAGAVPGNRRVCHSDHWSSQAFNEDPGHPMVRVNIWG